MKKIPQLSKTNKISFNIIANAVIGYDGLSGGDNIFINLAKDLIKQNVEVNIFTWKHGYLMCKKNGLDDATFYLSDAGNFEGWPFPLLFFIRTFLGLKTVKDAIKKKVFENKKIIIYSASDFFPDSIPALYLITQLKTSKWFAGFYLFAPNPLKGFRGFYKNEIRIPRIKDLLYWLMQRPIYMLIKKMADIVCVTSQPDVAAFVTKQRTKKNIFVVKGGIDYKHYLKYQKETKKEFDGVFLGRFHPQKGVLEMIDIWKIVVDIKPLAKLAVIGMGELEEEMKKKIEKLGLQTNIIFFGPLLGDKRNLILQKSKIILHPAIYDSGGMAAASGLACGLPGVCFNLPVFHTYYPNGFLRAEVGDFNDFAQKIITLLNDKKIYAKNSRQAIQEAKTWDWSYRTNVLLDFVNKV